MIFTMLSLSSSILLKSHPPLAWACLTQYLVLSRLFSSHFPFSWRLRRKQSSQYELHPGSFRNLLQGRVLSTRYYRQCYIVFDFRICPQGDHIDSCFLKNDWRLIQPVSCDLTLLFTRHLIAGHLAQSPFRPIYFDGVASPIEHGLLVIPLHI